MSCHDLHLNFQLQPQSKEKVKEKKRKTTHQSPANHLPAGCDVIALESPSQVRLSTPPEDENLFPLSNEFSLS